MFDIACRALLTSAVGLALFSAGCASPAPPPLVVDSKALGITSTPEWTAAEQDDVRGLAWADADGDGYLDLAVATYGGPVRLYSGGPSSGPALTLTWSSLATYNANDLAWGDWNGDGYPELVVALDGQADVLFSNAAGVLVPGWSSPFTEDSLCLGWADMDNDNDLDLVVGTGSGSPTRVLLGDGAGALLPFWTSTATLATSVLALGDIEGDGDIDLVVESGGPAYSHINSSGTLGAAVPVGSTWAVLGLSLSDYDGDGDLDLAVGDINQHRVYLKRWDSNASQWESFTYYSPGNYPGAVQWYRSGSNYDSVLIARSNGVTVLNRNLSAPQGFQLGQNTSVPGGDVRAFALGALYGGRRTWVAVGGLTGLSLHSVGTLSYEADYTSGINAREPFDSDGDLDFELVVATNTTNVVQSMDEDVFLGQWSTPESERSSTIGVGDWNGDGANDIVFTGIDSQGAGTRLYVANGGNWSLIWSDTTSPYREARFADVTGDGQLEILLASEDPAWPVLTVLRRDPGTGLPISLFASTVANGGTQELAPADFDGDGDVDVAFCGNIAVGSAHGLFVNDGVGGLSLDWVPAETNPCGELDWMDVDADGDLDLGTNNQWYLNTGGVLGLADYSYNLDPNEWSDEDQDGLVETVYGVGTVWNGFVFDVDGDGDVEMLTGAYAYVGNRFGRTQEPNHSTSCAVFVDTGGPAVARPYSQRYVIDTSASTTVPVTLRLTDPESDPIPEITWEYSLLGNGNWLPATTTGPGTVLPSGPDGADSAFLWDVTGIESDRAILRATIVRQNPMRVTEPWIHGRVMCRGAPIPIRPCWPNDADGDGARCVVDCDDAAATVYPGATELCDGLDQDCDGNPAADEVDVDGDGVMICAGDCADGNTAVNPSATEVCNGVDDDCDSRPPDVDRRRPRDCSVVAAASFT